MSPRKSLTATNLAAHQQLDCDLYIHNVYNGKGGSAAHTGTSSPSELAKAHFKRGLDWETCLYSWLDRSQLLLRVPSVPLDPDSLLENILADDRKLFFITGLSFWPPQSKLAARFSEGTEPLTFGLAKPDLLEIRQTDKGIYWRVIDAKASKHVKVNNYICPPHIELLNMRTSDISSHSNLFLHTMPELSSLSNSVQECGIGRGLAPSKGRF